MVPDVIVIGSLNLDHVITVEQLPQPGETISGRGYVALPGGKGLNQAVSASRQGAKVAMVGCVGDDAVGTLLLAVLAEEGIDASQVRTVAGMTSGTALITVARGGANTIVVAAGTNGAIGVGDVQAAATKWGTGAFGAGTAVLTQLEIPLGPVQAGLSIARARGAVTVLNPAPAPSALPRGLLELVDVLVPNETEALALSGARTEESAARELLAQGCGSVVVTLGERGALVARPGRPSLAIAPPTVEAVDTTAAGDAFCGALAAALASGHDLVGAVRRGCAAGALAATVMGAVPSLPTAAEVDGALRR